MASLTLHPVFPATLPATSTTSIHNRPRRGARRLITTTTCKAEPSGGNSSSTVELAAGAVGLASSAVVGWSLYTLKTTGCGLPPGPGGALGAAEGVSYLVVAALIGWSLTTKARTGSGLPAGPFGLLGAAEGVSYLAAAAIVVVFGWPFFEMDQSWMYNTNQLRKEYMTRLVEFLNIAEEDMRERNVLDHAR